MLQQKQLVSQLAAFSTECAAQQGKISTTAKRSEKIGPLALDEMELAVTKWGTIHNAVSQNKEKAELLLKNWEKYTHKHLKSKRFDSEYSYSKLDTCSAGMIPRSSPLGNG